MTEGRTLRRLIETSPAKIGLKMVYIVAFKLAWSTVCLCSGNWLTHVWDDGSIWFVGRREGLVSPHPYFWTCLPNQHEHHCTELCFECPKETPPHRYKLLSLGLMLMVLRIGLTAKQVTKLQEVSEACADNMPVIADLYFRTYWRELQDETEYLNVVKACLDRDFGIRNDTPVPPNELRAQLLQRIAAPLYKALRYYCPSPLDLERALNDDDLMFDGDELPAETSSTTAVTDSDLTTDSGTHLTRSAVSQSTL